MIEIVEKIKQKVFDVFEENDNIVVVLLIGSYARHEQKVDSDIDLMIVARDKERLLCSSYWINQFGSIMKIEKEDLGTVTSLRAYYKEYEIEFGIGNEIWLDIPLDTGTEKVLKDGYVVLYDRNNRMNSIRKAIEEKEFT